MIHCVYVSAFAKDVGTYKLLLSKVLSYPIVWGGLGSKIKNTSVTAAT